MTEINFNPNGGRIADFPGLGNIGAAEGTGKTGNVDPKNNKGISITDNAKAGSAPAVGNAPELDEPETPDTENTQEVVDNLDTGNTSTMFLLSEIMRLMLDCGKTLRASEREIRKSANQQVQKAIQNQADQQRNAAITGLVVGIVGAAVSTIMTAKSFGTFKDNVQQMKSLNTDYNLGNLQKQLSSANSQLKTDTQSLTQSNQAVEEAAKGFTPEQLKTLDKQCAAPTQDQIDTAKNKLDTAQTQVDGANTKFEEAKTAAQEANTNLTKVDKELTSATEEYNNLKNNPEATSEQLKEARGKVADLTKQKNGAEKKATDAQENLKQASDTLDQAQQTRDTAATKYNKLLEDDNTRIDNQLADLKAQKEAQGFDPESNAGKEINYKIAKLENMKASNKVEASKNEFNKDFGEFQQAAGLMKADSRFQDVENARVSGEYKMQFCKITTDAINTIGQKTSEIMSSEATRQGAETKKAENTKDEIQELFTQTGEVINSALDLMRSVAKMESQTNQTIIQA